MKTPGLADVSTATTYAGAGTSVLAGLSLNELGVIIGMLIGITGLLMQTVFALRADQREEQAHKRRMENMSSSD